MTVFPLSTTLLAGMLGFAQPVQLPAQPPAQPSAQPLCADASAFLRTDRQMAVIVEADTLDDWRTRQKLVGCRITAAGGTTRGVQPEAVLFYERVRATGWTRTPEPLDAPNEASLRFRMGKADCLFNVYGDAMLMTDAEDRADEAKPLGVGERRYHVYVMCVPALPAAPR